MESSQSVVLVKNGVTGGGGDGMVRRACAVVVETMVVEMCK